MLIIVIITEVFHYVILSGDLYILIHSTCELCATRRNESDHVSHFVLDSQRKMWAMLKLAMKNQFEQVP